MVPVSKSLNNSKSMFMIIDDSCIYGIQNIKFIAIVFHESHKKSKSIKKKNV